MRTPASTSLAPLSEASESSAWLDALRASGPVHDHAVERLHELLLRAARFEISRRRASVVYVRGDELDDIAMQAADDALVAVLAKLPEFRGASRFTTLGVQVRAARGRSALAQAHVAGARGGA